MSFEDVAGAAAITKVLTNIMKGVKTVLFSCAVVTATVDVTNSASKLSNYCNRNVFDIANSNVSTSVSSFMRGKS